MTDHDTTGQAAATPRALRASDADRNAIIEALQDAVARGQLTADEAGERMADAHAARYMDDLAPLTADLLPTAAPPPSPPGWRSLAAQTWAQIQASTANLTSGSLRSPRTIAVLAGVLLTLIVVAFLGTAALHQLFDSPPGPSGFGPPPR